MSEMRTEMYLDQAGRIQYKRSQNVDDILLHNQYEANNDAGAKMRFARKSASVPNIVIEQWLKEGIDYTKYGLCPDTTKRIKAKLNSNEFKYFRTHNSRM